MRSDSRPAPQGCCTAIAVTIVFATSALVSPAVAGPFDVILADSISLTLCQGCGITLAGLDYGLIVNTGPSDITIADLRGAQFSVNASRPEVALYPFINIPNEQVVGAIHPGEAMGSIFPGNELLLPLIHPGETLRDLAGLQFMAYEVERDFNTYEGPIRWDVTMTMAGREARFAIRADVHLGLHAIRFLTATRVSAESPNHDPVCAGAVAATPVLWPPSSRMVPVEITGVTDPDGDPVTIAVTGITQDEPLGSAGPRAGGCADGEIVDGGAQVRAQRQGDGNGRVYAVQFVASDSRGGRCEGSVRVCVPVTQRQACVDDGQAYNSLGDCPPGPVALGGVKATDAGSWATMVEGARASGGRIEIEVFDMSGRRVTTIVRAAGSEGFDARSISGVAPGLYFLRGRAGELQASRKVYLAGN